MDSLHFGIRSGKHGDAANYVGYITRQGRHAERGDLVATGYGNMPAFAATDPSLLWKASDKYERKNGSTFRAFTISLPNVLSEEQLTELAWEEARALAGTKPFQFALHMGLSSLRSELHPHVHITICDRLPDGIERSDEQTFKRFNATHPERGGCRKDSGGRTPSELREQAIAQRSLAAETINTALERYGHTDRIDHRTLRERGIARNAERYLGPAAIRTMSKEDRQNFLGQTTGSTSNEGASSTPRGPSHPQALDA